MSASALKKYGLSLFEPRGGRLKLIDTLIRNYIQKVSKVIDFDMKLYSRGVKVYRLNFIQEASKVIGYILFRRYKSYRLNYVQGVPEVIG